MNDTDIRLNMNFNNKINRYQEGSYFWRKDKLERIMRGSHRGFLRAITWGAYIRNNSSSCKLITCALYCIISIIKKKK